MSEARDEAKKEAALQAVKLIFMIVTVLAVMAMSDPDFIRTTKMRAAKIVRERLDRLAHRCGFLSMGTELKTGKQRYAVPLQLSLVRDKAAAAYEKARGRSRLCRYGERRWHGTPSW